MFKNPSLLGKTSKIGRSWAEYSRPRGLKRLSKEKQGSMALPQSGYRAWMGKVSTERHSSFSLVVIIIC
jgi:hypothetical protein